MSGVLYGRKATVQIGRFLLETEGEHGLRVEFDVFKDATLKNPNTCMLRVHNLAERTRRELDNVTGEKARELRTLNLHAGYLELVGLIFTGEVDWLQSRFERPSWVTYVHAITGHTAARAIADLKVKKGKQKKDHLVELLGAIKKKDPLVEMKAAVEKAKAGDFKSAFESLTKSVSFTGSALTHLDRVAKELEVDVFDDDDEIHVLNKTQVLPGEGVVLTPDSGLIGVPERVQQDDRPDDVVIRAQALLHPSITVGRQVIFKSRSYSGTGKVVQIKHVGDTHGPSWQSEMETIGL